MNKRTLLFSLVGTIVVAGALIASLLLLSNDGINIHDLNEAEFRQYAVETVGVQEVINALRRNSNATFRTDEDRRVHDRAESRWLDEMATDEEIERWWYVAALQLVIIEVGRYLDREYPELFLPDGQLNSAYYEAMDQCAADNGYPDLILVDPPPMVAARIEAETGVKIDGSYRDRLKRDFGLTLDGFFDIRHECAKIAQTYPTLDPAERDRILGIRDEEYWRAIRTIMLAEPDLIVPRLDPSHCTSEFLPECAAASR